MNITPPKEIDFFYEHNRLYIRQKACKRSILIGNNNQFFLSFPDILFIVGCPRCMKIDSYELGYIYAAFSLKNKVYKIPLYNVYKDGLICLGYGRRAFDNLQDVAKYVLNSFWQKSFQYEHSSSGSYQVYKNKKRMISDFEKWQKKTKNNWNISSRNLIEMDHEDVRFDPFFKKAEDVHA